VAETGTKDVITLGPDTPVSSPLLDMRLPLDPEPPAADDEMCACELDPGPLGAVKVDFDVLESGLGTLAGGGSG